MVPKETLSESSFVQPDYQIDICFVDAEDFPAIIFTSCNWQ